MNTLELRGNIITMLGSVTEKKQLKVVNDLLVNFLEDKEDWLTQLPKEIQESIAASKKIAKESPDLMKPHSEVKKKYEKYLN